MAKAAIITEERTFSIKVGDRTVGGMAVESAWNGFTKYVTPTGEHLIVLDADKEIITGSATLMLHLDAFSEPEIGDMIAGGMYVGVTEVDGKPARLILLPNEAKDVSWDTAMEWAKLQGGDLPTPGEQKTLLTNAKKEFAIEWYWSNMQNAEHSNYAWFQYFGDGFKNVSIKSYPVRARAVRRLPI